MTPRSTLLPKHVLIDGRWTTAPYILTRNPQGRLSDRPANGGDKK